MVEGKKLLHGGDAFFVQAGLSVRAYSGQVAEVEMSDGARELRRQQAYEAIGLLHVAGDFGEVAIGRHADGAAQGYANIFVDGFFDLKGDLASSWWLLLAAHELADHFVDGWRVSDGAGQLDCFRDFVRVLCVVGVIACDEDDAGTELFGFADLRSSFDAESFGFVASRNTTSGVGHGGDDSERLAAIFLVELLFDGREEAIQVDVEIAEAVGMEGYGHGQRAVIIYFIFAFYLPSMMS
jgi:hypothetical protein